MLSQQLSDYALKLIATQVGSALLVTPKMGLFTGNPALNNLTVLATLVALEPTYTGYAEVALVPASLSRNAVGDWNTTCGVAVFQPSAAGGTLPITVTGYFVKNTVEMVDSLVGSEYLTAPYTFVDEFSQLNIGYEIDVRNLLNWGGLAAQFS